MLALEKTGWGSAVVYPVNNVAIVMISALVAVLFFREKLTRLNMIGILVAIAAILLISRG